MSEQVQRRDALCIVPCWLVGKQKRLTNRRLCEKETCEVIIWDFIRTRLKLDEETLLTQVRNAIIGVEHYLKKEFEVKQLAIQ